MNRSLGINREMRLYLAIIWLGIFLALAIVALIAWNMNQTGMQENEKAYTLNMKFMTESVSKSVQLVFEGIVSEIVLLSQVEAVKLYQPKEVDLAFRSIISKHKERITHMVLMDSRGKMRIAVAKKGELEHLRKPLAQFHRETEKKWRVNINPSLFDLEGYRGIGVGMPIFRRLKTKDKSLLGQKSAIYESGSVISLVSVDGLAEALLDQLNLSGNAVAWISLDEKRIIGDKKKIEKMSAQIFDPPAVGADYFLSRFMKIATGEKVEDFNHLDNGGNTFSINAGKEVWYVTYADVEILDMVWKVAIASPEQEMSAIIRRGFLQSVQLFGLVVAILIAGAFFITRGHRRWAIAEEKALHAEELERKNRSLAEMNRRMDEFVAVVSHDIRTPLHVIGGFVKLIESSPDGKKFKRETDSMTRATLRMTQLVNDILDVSKLEAGKVELAYDPVDPGVLLHESVEIMLFSADEKKIDIDLLPADKIEMEGDSGKLSQVFNNLIGNAVKFTPAEGKITISRYADENEVHILFEDTGPGIPESEKEAVFDKFEQVKEHQQGFEPGSGLGLSICKNIVELHGGAISVENADGGGSVFHLVLPRYRKKTEEK